MGRGARAGVARTSKYLPIGPGGTTAPVLVAIGRGGLAELVGRGVVSRCGSAAGVAADPDLGDGAALHVADDPGGSSGWARRRAWSGAGPGAGRGDGPGDGHGPCPGPSAPESSPARRARRRPTRRRRPGWPPGRFSAWRTSWLPGPPARGRPTPALASADAPDFVVNRIAARTVDSATPRAPRRTPPRAARPRGRPPAGPAGSSAWPGPGIGGPLERPQPPSERSAACSCVRHLRGSRGPAGAGTARATGRVSFVAIRPSVRRPRSSGPSRPRPRAPGLHLDLRRSEPSAGWRTTEPSPTPGPPRPCIQLATESRRARSNRRGGRGRGRSPGRRPGLRARRRGLTADTEDHRPVPLDQRGGRRPPPTARPARRRIGEELAVGQARGRAVAEERLDVPESGRCCVACHRSWSPPASVKRRVVPAGAPIIPGGSGIFQDCHPRSPALRGAPAPPLRGDRPDGRGAAEAALRRRAAERGGTAGRGRPAAIGGSLDIRGIPRERPERPRPSEQPGLPPRGRSSLAPPLSAGCRLRPPPRHPVGRRGKRRGPALPPQSGGARMAILEIPEPREMIGAPAGTNDVHRRGRGHDPMAGDATPISSPARPVALPRRPASGLTDGQLPRPIRRRAGRAVGGGPPSTALVERHGAMVPPCLPSGPRREHEAPGRLPGDLPRSPPAVSIGAAGFGRELDARVAFRVVRRGSSPHRRKARERTEGRDGWAGRAAGADSGRTSRPANAGPNCTTKLGRLPEPVPRPAGSSVPRRSHAGAGRRSAPMRLGTLQSRLSRGRQAEDPAARRGSPSRPGCSGRGRRGARGVGRVDGPRRDPITRVGASRVGRGRRRRLSREVLKAMTFAKLKSPWATLAAVAASVRRRARLAGEDSEPGGPGQARGRRQAVAEPAPDCPGPAPRRRANRTIRGVGPRRCRAAPSPKVWVGSDPAR